jgi:hypothetical protein
MKLQVLDILPHLTYLLAAAILGERAATIVGVGAFG